MSVVERVLYVDVAGRELHARTLEPARREGKIRLLISFRGSGLQILEAEYSASKAPGTWHYPDQPS